MTAVQTVESACPVCRGAPAEEHARGKDFEYGTTQDHEWVLRLCTVCDVVLLSPRPADAEIGRIYPSNYYAYDFTGKKTLGYRVKTLLDRRSARAYLSHTRPGSNILDVGCGDGRLLRIFAELGVESERLFGMELDAQAVASAQSRGLRVVRGRVEDADYDPGFFGLAVLQQVLEHVSDPRAVIEKLHRILEPGGCAIFETPNTASWDHALFRRRYWGGYHIPRHFFLFRPASLTRLLLACGFEVVEVCFLASPSFWVQSVHHALAERGFPAGVLRFFDPHLPSPLALALFTGLDAIGKVLHVTSNMRLIAVRR
ncbi:MAG: class I SAM-dependent methyltransferase [Thermoanaerobaculia bacterium]